MAERNRKDPTGGHLPADAPDVMPPHPLPPPDPDERPDGNNDTIHHPDPRAQEHPAHEVHKTRGPYPTGNT